MRRVALVLLGLGLAGCVSVPLSTMVRMSTFDTEDFVQLDPAALRVRITLPEAFVLDAAKSWLGVEITSPAGTHAGEFKLMQEASAPARVSTGLFSSDVPATAYTLRLAEPSTLEFRRLQAFIAKNNRGDATIRVVPILSSFPEDAASTKVWIDLQLSQAQGFFTLLDGADVPMDRIRAASAEAGGKAR
jgi:hypothetical protein